MATSKKSEKQEAESRERRQRLLALLKEEVREETGDGSTLEERNDAAFEVLKDALWRREGEDLQGAVTTAVEVEVEGKRYRRLKQASAATYYGRWGSHEVEEPLYRQAGVRNGATIKPLELKMGMIGRHMTPDLACVMGELCADRLRPGCASWWISSTWPSTTSTRSSRPVSRKATPIT